MRRNDSLLDTLLELQILVWLIELQDFFAKGGHLSSRGSFRNIFLNVYRELPLRY